MPYVLLSTLHLSISSERIDQICTEGCCSQRVTELQVLHEHCFDPHSRLIGDINFLVEIPKVLKWDVPKAWEHIHAETSNIEHIYINISRQFFD